jgi:hypothetical protein
MRENRPNAEADASPRAGLGSRASARRFLSLEWPWLLAIALGAVLRAHRVLDQAPVDDEWHSIHHLLLLDYAAIATGFGEVDWCIPLTLYLKLVADTIGLGDVALRLPSLAFGIATLAVAPLLMREHLGRRGSHAFAWLLAVSPLLILYSRYARPYDIGALLCFVALSCCERWWRSGAWRHALGYGFCSALAAWFLLVTLPFTLAALVVLAGMALAERPAALLRRVGPPALAALLFALPLLGPPLWAQPGHLTAKLGISSPDLGSLGRAAAFLLGSHSPWLGALLLGLGGIGARALWRRAPVWTALAAGGGAALAVGVFVAAPAYSWLGFVIARYALPALPVFLACVAAGLVALLGGLRPRSAPLAAAVGLGALLLWAGRVPAILLETPVWFPARWITEMEGDVAEPRRIPEFYRRLAAEPAGSFAIVEAPWTYSLWNSLIPAYERVHRQRTLVGFTTRLCTAYAWGEYPPEAGIGFRAFVHLRDDDAMRARGVRYVVLHRDLDAEMVRVIDPIGARATGFPDVRGCAEAFRRAGWAEVFRDDAILVFEVPAAEPLAGDAQSSRIEIAPSGQFCSPSRAWSSSSGGTLSRSSRQWPRSSSSKRSGARA